MSNQNSYNKMQLSTLNDGCNYYKKITFDGCTFKDCNSIAFDFCEFINCEFINPFQNCTFLGCSLDEKSRSSLFGVKG